MAYLPTSRIPLRDLDTDAASLVLSDVQPDGVTDSDAERLLKDLGPNIIPEKKPDSFLVRLLRQFTSPIMLILAVAASLALLIGELTDGLIITFVLLLNSIIGVIQEGKAASTLASLRTIEKHEVFVIRSGVKRVIPSASLVPGDIVLLNQGDTIPADAILLETDGLRVDEASLTGESEPVHKHAFSALDDSQNISLGIVFSGTRCVRGGAKAFVYATGGESTLGFLAETIQRPETEIPLQQKIRFLTRIIIAGSFIGVFVTFFAGILLGHTAQEMLTTVISLMVSVIPEGLPITITLILAIGVSRMAQHKVLVKRLQAVETLGQADILAVDKTGTLTKNELSITEVFVADTRYEVGGTGYDPHGDITVSGATVDIREHTSLQDMAFFSSLAANASLIRLPDDPEQPYRLLGDPTEVAFLIFGQKLGFNKDVLAKRWTMFDSLSFDFRKKYYAIGLELEEGNTMIVTGAAEVLVDLSTSLYRHDSFVALSDSVRNTLLQRAEDMQRRGLRVLALAIKRDMPHKLSHDDVQGLVLVGLVGMQDTLRQDVEESVLLAKEAGMRVVMITGDNPVTAEALAKQAGIFESGDTVLTGHDINALSKDQLAATLPTVSVFARVTPEHKMKIIEGYKMNGNTTVMTGDGVNDGPSLAAAHLGVAMGSIGTDVAKDAADLVILNDSFGVIPFAVEEGRYIFRTIQKTVLYLLSTNLAELLVIVTALFLLLPLPLTSAQIVWLNLITDSFLVLAFALEPRREDEAPSKDTYGMRKGDAKKILTRPLVLRLFILSLTMTLGSLFVLIRFEPVSHVLATSLVLTVLTLFQVWNIWLIRTKEGSVFVSKPLRNVWLVLASLFVLGLQVAALYVPFMQKLLDTTSLAWSHWIVVLLVSFVVIVVDELYRLLHPDSFSQ